MLRPLPVLVTTLSLVWGLLAPLIGCNELMTDVERGGPAPDPDLPEVHTVGILKIAGNSALGSGNVINAGASPVTARGMCWNTSGNPATTDSTAANGSGVGEFALTPMANLKTNTVYYARAYATNSQGTAYGAEIAFDSGFVLGTSLQGGLVYSNDGHGGGWVVESSDSDVKRAWSNITDIEIGGTGNSMLSGQANTELIISQTGHLTSPAQECANLVSSGYDDWYLPSLGTVRAHYLWLHKSGLGNFKYPVYWSSTEVDSLNAWAMVFDGTRDRKLPKTHLHFWRCVRFAEQL